MKLVCYSKLEVPEISGIQAYETNVRLLAIGLPTKPDEGFFLYEFDANSTPLSDTWYLSSEDAKHQAEFDFGHTITNWTEFNGPDEDFYSVVEILLSDTL